jgi:hypothetical protein
MWPGRICNEGLCSKKNCTCGWRNNKGSAKRGRQAGHRKTIKKRRAKDEAYSEDGNYIKRKKASIKVVKVDDSDDEKKPAAATKGEADEDKK